MVMQRVTMTYQDYYGDLSVWLPPFYFSKLVRECLEKSVALYLFALLRRGVKKDGKGKDPKPFRDPLVIGQKVRNDRAALAEFFTEYEEELTQAGLRETAAVELQLLVLDHIVDLFEGGVTVESEATAPLLREFGPWGVEALVVVSFLRGDKEKEKLKESLTRYFDRFIKPSILAPAPAHSGSGDSAGKQPPQPAGGAAAEAGSGNGGNGGGTVRASARFVFSPFDPDVDIDALVTGVKRPKPKK